MRRRQRFYRNHPVEAAQATPEERGEDTERTIFSPSDTISLSIEYIRWVSEGVQFSKIDNHINNTTSPNPEWI